MKLSFTLTMVSLLTAAQVAGYEPLRTSGGTPIRWPGNSIPVSYQINEAGSADVPLASAVSAITASAGAWQAVAGSLIAFTYRGQTTQTRTGNDNINLVRWYETGFPFDETSLAVTVNTFNDISGEILDADINVNGEFRWRTDGSTGFFDIQNVMTHEFGHFVGLNHSPVRSSTMAADARLAETGKRTLENDDIAGIRFLYPEAANPIINPGDVDLSGRVDGRDMVLLALAFGATTGSARYNDPADFNDDGKIDGEDLAILGDNFGVLF